MFIKFVPVKVIKGLMYILPSASLHGNLMTFEWLKTFYGAANFDTIGHTSTFSVIECLTASCVCIIIWASIYTILALCKSRICGHAPLGWSGLFSLRKWRRLIRGANRLQIGDLNQSSFEIENLSKTYHGEVETKALQNFSLSVKAGEVIVFIGPNGSGKSTLFNTLIGFIEADCGSINFFGEEIKENFGALYQCLGYVAQESIIIKEITVRENLMLFAQISGLSAEKTKYDAQFFSNAFSLNDILESLAGDISGGEKRKLSLIIALMQRPAVLILDEPTAGVDVQNRQQIWKMVRSYTHTTTFIAVHSLEEAESVASRIIVMKNGELSFGGTPAEMRQKTGCGYILTPTGEGANVAGALSIAQRIFPEAELTENGRSIVMPLDLRAADVVASIDRHKSELRSTALTVHVESLEHKLLRFIEENEGIANK
jgi:ABC-type multidrug transport system ATPase subunit